MNYLVHFKDPITIYNEEKKEYESVPFVKCIKWELQDGHLIIYKTERSIDESEMVMVGEDILGFVQIALVSLIQPVE